MDDPTPLNTAFPPTTSGPETSGGDVEIRQDQSVAVAEALGLAHAIGYPVGKSTLQRWARHWAEAGAASPVKCILVTNRLGSAYRIDKSDFEAWVLEQQANQQSRETPPDPTRPREAS